tara:strand:- start:8 stop:1042 length:1035 start_codon:yes stop_codon:yes gene_type:complete
MQFSLSPLKTAILAAGVVTLFAYSHAKKPQELATAQATDWTPAAEDWLTLPDGMENMGGAHGDVAVASNGDVYVSLTSGLRAGMQVYSAKGKFIRNVKNAPSDFHGFVIHEDADGTEYIYGPQLSGAKIVKLTLDGEVVLTIPGEAIPIEYWKVNPKNKKPGLRLTACDVAPNGDIFVTDGYSTDRVHRFNAEGKYLATFGGKDAPYHFSTLHKIAVDTRFDPARIVGVSRTDGRVVHMSMEGEYLGNVATDLLKPAALVIQGDLLAVGEILGRVSIFDKDGTLVKQLGANENADEVGTNKTDPAKWRKGVVNAPHGVAFNSSGDLFVAEYSVFGRIVRFNAVR